MTAELSDFVLDLAIDTKAFVTEAIEKHTAALTARCLSLEQEVRELKALQPITGPPGESVVGPKGDPGPQGERGPSGEQGPQGLPGESIAGPRGERGEKGQDGINGKDVDLSLILSMQANLSAMQGEWAAFKTWQAGAITDAVAQIQPVAPDPVVLDGLVQKHLETQHKAIDEDALVLRVKSAVLQEIPTPRDGKDGKDGRDGQSIDPSVVDVMVAGVVEKGIRDILPTLRSDVTPSADVLMPLITKALEALPKPKDGLDGKDGEPGPQGERGPQGPPGEPGRDGRDGLAGVAGPAGDKGLDGKDGLDGLPGKDGLDGLHGKDGLGFDDLELTFDETKGYALRVVNGERVKEWPLPVPFDDGTWKPGKVYPKGAMLTDHGAYYIARMQTSARPGQPDAASRAWRLAVKSGKDGKPGKDGKDGV